MAEITITLPWLIWTLIAVWFTAVGAWLWASAWLRGARKTWECLNPDKPFPTIESIRADIERRKAQSL